MVLIYTIVSVLHSLPPGTPLTDVATFVCMYYVVSVQRLHSLSCNTQPYIHTHTPISKQAQTAIEDNAMKWSNQCTHSLDSPQGDS